MCFSITPESSPGLQSKIEPSWVAVKSHTARQCKAKQGGRSLVTARLLESCQVCWQIHLFLTKAPPHGISLNPILQVSLMKRGEVLSSQVVRSPGADSACSPFSVLGDWAGGGSCSSPELHHSSALLPALFISSPITQSSCTLSSSLVTLLRPEEPGTASSCSFSHSTWARETVLSSSVNAGSIFSSSLEPGSDGA